MKCEVKCEVWSVMCGVWSVQPAFGSCAGGQFAPKTNEVRNVERGVWSVECAVETVKCGVWSVQRGVVAVLSCSEVCSLQCVVSGVQCEVLKFFSLQRSVKCTVQCSTGKYYSQAL